MRLIEIGEKGGHMHRFATCVCGRYQHACTRTATQEDLLCDTCRAGCSLVEIYPAGTTLAATGRAAPTEAWHATLTETPL